MPQPDEQRLDQLLAMLRAGNSFWVAVRAAGVTPDQVSDLDKEQLEQAMAEGEARAVTQIAQAARSNWQAAAWLLERSYPERWGRWAKAEEPVVASTDGVDELAAQRVARRASS